MVISGADAPTEDERQLLAVRQQELQFSLAPAGEDAIRPHIASVMVSLKHSSESAEDRAAIQRIFAADLADLPLFAIEHACKAFRQGKAGDGHWMPTQAEIRRVAEAQVHQFRQEQEAIKTVLAAIVVTTEDLDAQSRKRGLERWDKIKAGMVRDCNPDHKKPLSQVTREEAEQNLERLKAEPVTKIALSPALREKLNLPPLGDDATDQELGECLR
jgi:hypothetical protein